MSSDERMCRFACIVLGFASCFFTCNFPSEVGIDLVDEDPLTVTYHDTVSIEISTVRFDSLRTSDSDRMLVGHSIDERLGEVTAMSYFQVGKDSLDTYPDEEKAVYDSIALEIFFDGYSYYDTTKLQTFSFYWLQEELELGDDGFLYNVNKFEYQVDSISFLGKMSLFPRVRKGDVEYLRINDGFGKNLFELLRTEDEIIESNNDFLEYMNGFVLVPDSTNTCFLALRKTTNIKLFYTQDGEQVEQVFPIAGHISYTNVSAQYADSPLALLSSQEEVLPSSQADGMAFIQGSVGLGIRIEFPYLNYVRELSENNLVTGAELILTPVKGSYSGLSPLSGRIHAYKVDKFNNIEREILIDQVLYYDDEYGDETFYSIDINGFIDEQLDLLESEEEAILFTLPPGDQSATANRIYFGDENHEDKSFLKLLIMNINDTF